MYNFIFASDLHGIEQHKKAVAAFKTFVDDFDPGYTSIRVFGGDLWNLAALRRQADEYEKNIRLKEDFQAGLEFLEWYKPQVLLVGNHDQRLWDAVKRERVNRTGWLAELAESYLDQFKEFAQNMNIKVLPYDKRRGIYRVHGLSFAHGYGAGENLTSNMTKAYGHVVHGHGHRIERVTEMHANEKVTGYQVGCLCRDDMDYTRADLGTLKQQQGWAYGAVGAGMQPAVFQATYTPSGTMIASALKRI